jgi:hypothetical protein
LPVYLILFYDIVRIEQGTDNVALWAGNVGNSWRTTHDIRDEWESMINNIDFVRKSVLHSLHKYVLSLF